MWLGERPIQGRWEVVASSSATPGEEGTLLHHCPSSLGESSTQVAWPLVSMLLPTPMGLGGIWPWVLGPGRRLNVP